MRCWYQISIPISRKKNKNKFESNYDTKPQTAIAGTKHSITTDTNKVIHQKLNSKALQSSFQNPLSRRGKNRRGPDGKFAQKALQQTEEDNKGEELEEIEETEEQDQAPQLRQLTP